MSWQLTVVSELKAAVVEALVEKGFYKDQPKPGEGVESSDASLAPLLAEGAVVQLAVVQQVRGSPRVGGGGGDQSHYPD